MDLRASAFLPPKPLATAVPRCHGARNEGCDWTPVTISKEIVRLRLYLLCLLGDMAALFLSFLVANFLVLGAWAGEPGKPHGLVMFAIDVDKVGLAAQQTQFGSYVLKTTGCEQRDSGNSRCGHEYGTSLSAEEKRALLEYLKVL